VNLTVSIIVRTTASRIDLLDQSLFSIYGSDYSDIEVIIVAQTENNEAYQEVQALGVSYITLGMRVKVIRNPTQRDERARNLNFGIAASTGRYIGFLDDDDVLYPEHISTLVNILKSSESAAWAYADAVAVICINDALGNLYYKSQKLLFKKQAYSLVELWIENFIPIHTYIIDRYRLDNCLLQFDESFTLLEDYAFLLKLSAMYNPIYCSRVTCEYRFRLDGSNSSCMVEEIYGMEALDKRRDWELARSQINEIKQMLLSAFLPNQKMYNEPLAITLFKQLQEEARKNYDEKSRLQETIEAMESSKFWKIRKMWVKLKKIFRLPVND
jgi:glycosyltransferase involved in cell wall biosynthesis